MAFSKAGRDSAESARLYAMMAAVPPATVKAYLRHMLAADRNRDLKELKVPLALAFTEKAWKAGESAGTTMRAFGMEDTTLASPLRIANSGPQPMKDQPDAVASWISEFAVRSFAEQRLAEGKR
jgi:hypothetical protein